MCSVHVELPPGTEPIKLDTSWGLNWAVGSGSLNTVNWAQDNRLGSENSTPAAVHLTIEAEDGKMRCNAQTDF